MGDMISHPGTYFRQFVPERDDLLTQLEQEAAAEAIPIVGPLVGQLLFILARACKARRILELGTATGYSTIWLARGCADVQGHVVSIEADPDMAVRAARNFENAGVGQRIDIIPASTQSTLPGLSGPFDLVFLDIDKAAYAHALPHCHRLLRSGGLLIADNTGFADATAFNHTLYASHQWSSVQLFGLLPGHSPEQDGLAFALRR